MIKGGKPGVDTVVHCSDLLLGLRDLYPQLLEVLPADKPQQPALLGNCLRCRELPQLKMSPNKGIHIQ